MLGVLLFDMHLDVSQVFTVMFSVIGSTVMIIVGVKIKKYYKGQEAAAETIRLEARERERKQELHFKKWDATIYALGAVLDQEKGKLFKHVFDQQMSEYYAEKNFIQAT